MAPVAAAPGVAGVVIAGDLNAPPGEAAHGAFKAAGYRSASVVRFGVHFLFHGAWGFLRCLRAPVACEVVCRVCCEATSLGPARPAGAVGVVIAGDLNAPPGEAAHGAFKAAGYRSASVEANGREPAVTWPSGLVAPLMDSGEPHCADYIYVSASPGYALRVTSAALAGGAAAAGDATLFPSDHLGIRVALSVSRAR
ncbi:MAG: hypothetical protein J3K34DRAFT_144441 [Monoraphidium minutum]|nr:MAG: hypothetical protein J3K34DRAFT_144441 [Monoraphidium minutum]